MYSRVFVLTNIICGRRAGTLDSWLSSPDLSRLHNLPLLPQGAPGSKGPRGERGEAGSAVSSPDSLQTKA